MYEGKKIDISDKEPTTMRETDLKRKDVKDIPLKLGFYILQKFDYKIMVIDVEGKELKVTTESVHDMLGIPTGGTILTQLEQWPKDDTSYDEWKQQFKE
ncbi:unnamed protein product [Lactuca virosa]|uniref:Ubiquitin-like domain-containing protein n=1 Tax=Lactuca virosa TaxID=75947 RepID=A0AAU9MAX9_9ASTR|nr:unnamed protein product [Lactuca virosa]